LPAILQLKAGRYTAIVVPVRLAEPPPLHAGRYMLSSVSARLAFFPTQTGGSVLSLPYRHALSSNTHCPPGGRRQCRIVWQSGRTAARHFPRINVAFSSYSLELNTELNSRRYPPPSPNILHVAAVPPTPLPNPRTFLHDDKAEILRGGGGESFFRYCTTLRASPLTLMSTENK